MLRRIALILSLIALVGFIVPDLSPVHVQTAYAQSKKPKRKNLLELLFNRMKKQADKARKRVKKPKASVNRKNTKNRKNSTANRNVGTRAKSVKVSRKTGSRSTAAAVAARAPKPEAVDKNEDAAKLLVIGDFMAGGMAEGLEEIFSQNPSVRVLDKSNGLSGMVRDDVINWPEAAGQLIDEEKPIAVLVLVGMNDRQQMRTSQGKFNKLTDEWRKKYQERVGSLVSAVREKRLPLIWVGLPPVSKNSMNTDYLVFNEIFQSQAEAAGGSFVDVWKGFVDEEGRYVRSGPDVNGQIVTLRGSDGINMTRNGKTKLAFYVEKLVKRLTGFGREALFSSVGSLGDAAMSQEPQYDPAGTGKTVVIALGSPAADGGSQLEGAEGFIAASDARLSNGFELVARGRSAEPKAGRVDAQWGKPAFDVARGETPEPVLANLRGMNFRSDFEFLSASPGSEANPATDAQAKGQAEAPVSN